MTTKFLLISSLLSMLLVSCGVVGERHVVDSFYITAPDTEDQMSLYYKPGEDYLSIVEPQVVAVGNNKKYIWVVQHPVKDPNSPPQKINKYFIVPVSIKSPLWAEKEIFGPMDSTEFVKKCKDLGISNYSFEILYE